MDIRLSINGYYHLASKDIIKVINLELDYVLNLILK